MAWQIPASTPYSLREKDRGIVVWSLQRALADLSYPTVADGVFGPRTAGSVRSFQDDRDLAVDAVAGPASQRAIAREISAAQDGSCPRGLVLGFAESEGGGLLGAVNWSVPGGVDCGLFQRRVYESRYGDDQVVQRAFDAAYQARLLVWGNPDVDGLRELRGRFLGRAGTEDGHAGLRPPEKAWRLAALNHNYPAGADRLSRTPVVDLSGYWSAPQTWVTNVGARFPDGERVRTPLEWCHLYAGVLGDAHGHRGNVTKHVESWG